jgi:hypothetical protein
MGCKMVEVVLGVRLYHLSLRLPHLNLTLEAHAEPATEKATS